MAEVTLKVASQLIGYTNADVTIPVSDDITPEQLARLHWDWNVRFLLEQEKIANEPVTERQEKAISEAASKTVEAKLPATQVAEEKTDLDGLLDNPPVAEKKPWENKPSFDLF